MYSYDQIAVFADGDRIDALERYRP